MTKVLDERIDEGVLRRLGHVERMENNWIAKRVYVEKCWKDSVKECLRKRSMDVRQARRMVQDRNEWWCFVNENALGMNP